MIQPAPGLGSEGWEVILSNVGLEASWGGSRGKSAGRHPLLSPHVLGSRQLWTQKYFSTWTEHVQMSSFSSALNRRLLLEQHSLCSKWQSKVYARTHAHKPHTDTSSFCRQLFRTSMDCGMSREPQHEAPQTQRACPHTYLDITWVWNKSLVIYNLHNSFWNNCFLHAGHVEAIHVIPEGNSLRVLVHVTYGHKADSADVRVD